MNTCVDNLMEYQQERDRLNKEIDKQFMIIVMEGYTLEEKRQASKEHNELIKQYLGLKDKYFN